LNLPQRPGLLQQNRFSLFSFPYAIDFMAVLPVFDERAVAVFFKGRHFSESERTPQMHARPFDGCFASDYFLDFPVFSHRL
jgi:hypothetical protein